MQNYDSQKLTIQFTSEEEVARFHAQMTKLLRIGMSEVNQKYNEMQEGIAQTNAFFQEYTTVIDVLNSLRDYLPRKGV